MIPPKLIKPHVIKFCRRIVRNSIPSYLPTRPDKHGEPLNCFSIVEEKIKKEGGEAIIGWAIWEWPKVIIEAEFHCAWKNTDGKIIDITPRDPPIKRVLFIEDPRKKYEGFQIDNIRQALKRDSNILRMIELGELMFRELNRGELKHMHGTVPVDIAHDRYEEENKLIVQKLMNKYGHTLREAAEYSI